jgi:outer membrane protein assembly factor BamB
MRETMIALVLMAPLAARADDFATGRLSNWHHWRGPNEDGTAPNADPPVEWSATKNVAWNVSIPGSGSATPVVWGDRIFILTAVDTRKPGKVTDEKKDAGQPGFTVGAPSTVHRFEVLCLDRTNGKTLWSRTAVEEVPHEGRHTTNTYASGSPVTDGKVLIASFGSRGIFAYDLEGNLRWSRNLGLLKIKVGFGEGSSPVLHGDSLLVNCDHEAGSFIVCLDVKTGEPRWRKERDEGTTWTTPFVVDHAGTAQVIVNGTKKTRSYNLANGDLLWECGGMGMNPIAMPVARQGVVYCMTGYRGFFIQAIRLDSKGDVTGTDQVAWKRNDTAPYVASPLLYGDLLYVTKERQGVLTCLDAATGEVRFGPERLPGVDDVYASPVGAAGRTYWTGRNGTVLVLKHGPKFEVLASNSLGEGIDASPVLVGKWLYLRGVKSLWAITNP